MNASVTRIIVDRLLREVTLLTLKLRLSSQTLSTGELTQSLSS